MAALNDALRKSKGTRPPQLREATRPERSCAACRYFKALSFSAGACRRYSGARVKSGQVCDSWAAP